MRLAGKVAIITGAANGLGRDNARLFAKEGAKVAVADIDKENGQKIVRDIVASGGEAIFVYLDVSQEQDWATAVKTTVSKYGKIDILVNNAGISIKSPSFHETPLDVWESVYGTNAKGTFLGTRAVIPEMKKVGCGSIVNISSVSALVGGDNAAVYHASKGAQTAFTRAVAVEFGRDAIRCNAVCPGSFNAGILKRFVTDPRIWERNVKMVPLKRRGEPCEESLAVLYLASDESTYTTGIELVIDGGLIVRGASTSVFD